MKKLLVPSLLAVSGVACAAQQKDKPNVLMIVCDQLRYDCLGYTGSPFARTPNIDALAAEGMQFTRAYTSIPTSCPARQCLLSGAWPEQPGHEGLWNYDITLPVKLFEGDTWTRHLADRGYRLGYVGKWHVHPVKTPLEFGFSDYYGEASYHGWAQEHVGKKPKAHYHQEDNRMMGGYVKMDRDDNSVYWFKEKAVELIRQYEGEGKPWHVRLDYSEPHLPCMPLKPFFDRFKDTSIPPWGNFCDELDDKPYIQFQQVLNWGLEDYDWAKWENYLRSYYAVIAQVDDALGQLFRQLEEIGALDNTIIIFTADHGDAAGSHRMLDKHYVMYEEEVHVPLIIKWKDHIQAGTVCDRFLVHFLDIAATMDDLFSLDFPTSGRSLLPLLRGEDVDDWRTYAFSNYNGQQFGLFVQRMIRDERYKYVWTPTDIDELYDLQEDPYELKNLIHDPAYKDVLTRLRKDLYEDLVARKDAAAGAPSAAYRQLIGQKKR